MDAEQREGIATDTAFCSYTIKQNLHLDSGPRSMYYLMICDIECASVHYSFAVASFSLCSPNLQESRQFLAMFKNDIARNLSVPNPR